LSVSINAVLLSVIKMFDFHVMSLGGRLGAGKSAFAAYMAIQWAKRGRPVVANYALNVKTSVPWTDPSNFPTEKNALVILDELLFLSAVGLLPKDWVARGLTHARKMRQKVVLIHQGHRAPIDRKFYGTIDKFSFIESYWWFNRGRYAIIQSFDEPPVAKFVEGNGMMTGVNRYVSRLIIPNEAFTVYDSMCTWLGSPVADAVVTDSGIIVPSEAVITPKDVMQPRMVASGWLNRLLLKK
jgi:hypothetical protein